MKTIITALKKKKKKDVGKERGVRRRCVPLSGLRVGPSTGGRRSKGEVLIYLSDARFWCLHIKCKFYCAFQWGIWLTAVPGRFCRAGGSPGAPPTALNRKLRKGGISRDLRSLFLDAVFLFGSETVVRRGG